MARSATVALRFESGPRGVTVATIVDGNRNGVLVADIAQQTDRVIEPPMLLSDLFPGVAIDLSPLTTAPAAVALGATSLLSFTPNGTSTSGSIYLLDRDGTQWALRVLGVTARTRVLRFDTTSGQWRRAQ